MKGAIYILLTIIAAAIGAWQMYNFVNSVTNRNQYGDTTSLIISLVCIAIAIAFGGLYLAGRVNKEEELHITK